MPESEITPKMDLLTVYRATIDCRDLKVTLKNKEGREMRFYDERFGKEYFIISIMKVTKLLRQGCMGYLCYVTEVKDKEMRTEDIPMVYEFPNVFLKELLDLPPQREINFAID